MNNFIKAKMPKHSMYLLDRKLKMKNVLITTRYPHLSGVEN